MKLHLLFIVMDLLTILVYPFVFMYGKLRLVPKLKEGTTLTKLLVAARVTTGR